MKITWVSVSSQTIPASRSDEAHQQPGAEARVAQPARRGEETGELGRVDLHELVGLLAASLAPEAAQAAADHRLIPFIDAHPITIP